MESIIQFLSQTCLCTFDGSREVSKKSYRIYKVFKKLKLKNETEWDSIIESSKTKIFPLSFSDPHPNSVFLRQDKQDDLYQIAHYLDLANAFPSSYFSETDLKRLFKILVFIHGFSILSTYCDPIVEVVFQIQRLFWNHSTLLINLLLEMVLTF